MNVSALKQTGAHWEAIVDTLALLRAAYTEARGRYGPDLLDLWRVSQLGSALPWYFILRGETAPAYAAALAKATLGTAMVSNLGLCNALSGWSPPPEFTAAGVLELAEQWRTMIGRTEVCSASANMIEKFVEPLVGAPQVVRDVARLDAHRKQLMRFGAAYIALKHSLWIYYHARRFLYADVAVALGDAAPSELAMLLGAGIEPPDCYRVEPPNLPEVPPHIRAAWFHLLAGLFVPLAPDGSDAAIGGLLHRMADVMGEGQVPRVTYERLDAISGDMLAVVEAGLSGAPVGEPFDEAGRDAVLAASPRQMFASLPGYA